MGIQVRLLKTEVMEILLYGCDLGSRPGALR